MSDNKKIGQLTWLATFFLPFNFIAVTFCMQLHVNQITEETVKWYFTISVPLAITTLVLALAVSHLKMHALFKPILQFLGLGVWVWNTR
jgi:Mg2+ and Co2+ transporter CorA